MEISCARGRLILRCLAGGLFLWAVSQSAAATQAVSDEGRPVVHYEPFPTASFWGPPVIAAQLGRFQVPDNRSSSCSRSIELAFVRLPSASRRPGPPILWLSGGPGNSGIDDLKTP